ASAPGSPIPPAKLKRPRVAGSAPCSVPPDGMVVVVVVPTVVDVVPIVVDVVAMVEVVAVVEVVPPPPVTRAARLSGQFSTKACSVAELPVGARQLLSAFASSFAKHPLVGSRPPVYFAVALSTQPLAFGSVGFFGVCATWLHLSNAAKSFDTHFFLPAP